MRARLIAPLIALALTVATPARADLAAGLAAYDAEDWATALRELLPEAEAGNAEAQYRVGRIYRRGLSVPVDVDLALKWYEAAARNGSNKAMYGLGLLYDNGDQVVENSDRAECWYRLAAERGHSPAQHALSILVHTLIEWSESRHWRERAIAQGDAYALYGEANVLLLNPLDRDKTEAYMLLLLAADRGMPKAVERVERVRESGLTGEAKRQFEEARRLADAWVAKPEPQNTGPLDGIPAQCLGE